MTGARFTGRHTLTERIEQAIARGLPASRIAVDLAVNIDVVHAAWDHLDELVVEPEPVTECAPIATLPTYSGGRPIESYFGPAAREVIDALVDAVCPPQSLRIRRKKAA